MNKLLPLVIVIAALAAASVCPAQLDPITPEEQKAAAELRERFTKALDKEGRIDPLVKDLFTEGFVEEYLGSERSHYRKPDARVEFLEGLEYENRLLESASAADWQHLLIASFNFMHAVEVAMANDAAADKSDTGRSVDGFRLEQGYETVISKRVVDMFARDPSLKTFLRTARNAETSSTPDELKPARDPELKITPSTIRKDVQPMRTPEDLKRVASVLEEAFSVMIKESKPDARHFSARALEQINELLEDEDYAPEILSPYSADLGDAPKETRVIQVKTTPFDLILLVKTEHGYKVAAARVKPY